MLTDAVCVVSIQTNDRSYAVDAIIAADVKVCRVDWVGPCRAREGQSNGWGSAKGSGF